MSKHSAAIQRWMRQRGFECDTVERWLAFGGGKGGVRKDYCGFADIIGFGHSRFAAVQVFSMSSFKSHLESVSSNLHAFEWVRNGGEVWLVGLRKCKGEKGRLHWEPRVFVGEVEPIARKLQFKEVQDVVEKIKTL